MRFHYGISTFILLFLITNNAQGLLKRKDPRVSFLLEEQALKKSLPYYNKEGNYKEAQRINRMLKKRAPERKRVTNSLTIDFNTYIKSWVKDLGTKSIKGK